MKSRLLLIAAVILSFGLVLADDGRNEWDGGGVPSYEWPRQAAHREKAPRDLSPIGAAPVGCFPGGKCEEQKKSEFETLNLAPVPEPVGWGLITAGLVFSMLTRRRARS